MHDGHDASRSSWIALGIGAITRGACRWPKLTLWLVFVSTIACSAYAWKTLTIKTNRADLIDPRAPYQQRWNRYAEAFGDVTEDIVVVIEGANRSTVTKAIDELGPRIERDAKYFKNVLYKIDLRALTSKGLQYLPNEELKKLVVRLRKMRVMAAVMPGAAEEKQKEMEAAQSAAVADLAGQVEQLAQGWQNWSVLPADQRKVIREQTQALVAHLAQSSESEPAASRVDPLAAASVAGGIRYLLNDDETMGFIQAQPVVDPGDMNGATESVERMRRLVSAVQKKHPRARIGLTGVPVLEHDEMEVSQREMAEASLLSFFGVGIVLFAGFRRLRHPVLGMVMLLVGTAWSFAAAALAVGHLNILSIAFAAMLFGLGNDFAIVYMSHYAEQRERGLSLFDSILDASMSVGPGITTAALTAAAAFFAAVLTDFAGIAELGLIAGWGILLCNLLTFVFIPPALLVWDRNWELPPRRLEDETRTWPRWVPASVLAGFLILLGYFGQYASTVRYDMNLLNMQATGTEGMRVQERIEQKSANSILYAVSLAKNRADAIELKRRYEELPTVEKVEELASMLPPATTPRRQEMIDFIRGALVNLAANPPSVPNPSRIGNALDDLHSIVSATPDAAIEDSVRELDGFLDRLSSMTLGEQIRVLTPGHGALPAEMASLAKEESATPVGLDDFPTAFTSRFVSRDQQWLVKVYPREAVWDGTPLKRFVEDVRSVDPEVTGTPIQNFEASQAIWDSYLEAGSYALVAVLILLWWDFRTIHETLLAISPAACGLFVTLGVLGKWDIPLNQANMIMLPLLLGLGVDGGVHVLHDYRAQTGRYSMSRSTARSILLTATTSIVGFGSLMIASHRGLFSLGFVLTVGVTAALLTSLVAIPSFLSLISPDDQSAVMPGKLRIVSADADRPAA